MVSNLSETLKKAYDDAVIAGKIEVAQYACERYG